MHLGHIIHLLGYIMSHEFFLTSSLLLDYQVKQNTHTHTHAHIMVLYKVYYSDGLTYKKTNNRQLLLGNQLTYTAAIFNEIIYDQYALTQ